MRKYFILDKVEFVIMQAFPPFACLLAFVVWLNNAVDEGAGMLMMTAFMTVWFLLSMFIQFAFGLNIYADDEEREQWEYRSWQERR